MNIVTVGALLAGDRPDMPSTPRGSIDPDLGDEFAKLMAELIVGLR